jgi:hypothetical protein
MRPVSARGRNGDDRPASQPADDRKQRRLHSGHCDDRVGLLDFFEPGHQPQNSRDAHVRDQPRSDTQIGQGSAGFFGHFDVSRTGGHDGDRTVPRRERLADIENERSRPRLVGRAARERFERKLFPALRRQPRDQNVVCSGKLARDFRDLRRCFAVGEHDFGKPEPPKAIEIESVVAGGHVRRLYLDFSN